MEQYQPILARLEKTAEQYTNIAPEKRTISLYSHPIYSRTKRP